MDVAEMSALSAPDMNPPSTYEFVNAKNNTIDLEFNPHFGGSVNVNMSAVHVPTNVYEGASPVIRAIKWSEALDRTFINNYEQDPSLSWQYFGSATGFMRQYPAINWYVARSKPICSTRCFSNDENESFSYDFYNAVSFHYVTLHRLINQVIVAIL